MSISKAKMLLGRRLIRSAALRRAVRTQLLARTALAPRGRPFTVVLSMGSNGHSYSAARAVKALGHRVLLITDSPQLHEMLYADAVLLHDPLTEIDAILRSLERFTLEAVMVSIKHLTLPAQARIAERFGLISVGRETCVLNNDKLAWREALAQSGVRQPAFSRDPDLFKGKHCIAKPISGTGSRGVVALGPDDDKTAYAGPDSFFEEAIAGDQYDYEGVVEDGTPRFLARVFERYIDINGTFAANFFLFNPQIDPARNAALEACAVQTLAASKVQQGGFHVEMRVQGDHAVPIDFANRMGYERFVSFAGGEDFGKAHANCFLLRKHSYAKDNPHALVQYFCWTQDQFDRAIAIRDANPDHVFDEYMKPHLFAGEPCFGMVAFYHDDMPSLLRMADGLGIYGP